MLQLIREMGLELLKNDANIRVKQRNVILYLFVTLVTQQPHGTNVGMVGHVVAHLRYFLRGVVMDTILSDNLSDIQINNLINLIHIGSSNAYELIHNLADLAKSSNSVNSQTNVTWIDNINWTELRIDNINIST